MLSAAVAMPASARAAELVMLESYGCGWCLRWHAEIGPIYPRTSEGALAPLRRVDLALPWPDDLAGVAKERFTPTFILMDEGREVGRIRGYPGESFFWELLGELMQRMAKEGG
ncbi:MAG: transcriptional regulator [Rhizobiales bacterium]|nr:transcriptional regulator [Hyphomicrobiales bacterium]